MSPFQSEQTQLTAFLKGRGHQSPQPSLQGAPRIPATFQMIPADIILLGEHLGR